MRLNAIMALVAVACAAPMISGVSLGRMGMLHRRSVNGREAAGVRIVRTIGIDLADYPQEGGQQIQAASTNATSGIHHLGGRSMPGTTAVDLPADVPTPDDLFRRQLLLGGAAGGGRSGGATPPASVHGAPATPATAANAGTVATSAGGSTGGGPPTLFLLSSFPLSGVGVGAPSSGPPPPTEPPPVFPPVTPPLTPPVDPPGTPPSPPPVDPPVAPTSGFSCCASPPSGPAGLSPPGLTPPPASIPEPATWVMLALGFGGLGSVIRRRRWWAAQRYWNSIASGVRG